MLPTDRPLSPDEIARAVKDVKDWAKETKRSHAMLAKGIGVSTTTVQHVMSGTYTGDAESIVRKLTSYMEQLAAASEVERPTGFVSTEVASKILTVVKMACDERGLGLVTGPAGIGKTECVRAAKRLRPTSIFIHVLSTERSCLGLIRALAAQVGVSMHRSISITQRAIIDRLAGSDRLLLIDEAHKLEHRALEVLRDINDCAKVPIVLIGTINVKALVDDTGANFGQFSSRVVARYDAAEDAARQRGRPGGRAKPAQLFSADEIVRMFEGSQLRLTDDAVGMLAIVANALGHGCLRLVSKLVSIASMHQKVKAKGEIDRGILVAILRQFYGDAYIDCISERSEQLGGDRLALTA